MELWFIKDKKWVALHLKDIEDEITPEEIHFQILTYVRHIKYPPFVSFSNPLFIHPHLYICPFIHKSTCQSIHPYWHSFFINLFIIVHSFVFPSILLSSFFQFVYTGDDFEDEYSGSRLDFLLVFHTADQQEEMKEKIVIPLSKELRLYYAFILIDG